MAFLSKLGMMAFGVANDKITGVICQEAAPDPRNSQHGGKLVSTVWCTRVSRAQFRAAVHESGTVSQLNIMRCKTLLARPLAK